MCRVFLTGRARRNTGINLIGRKTRNEPSSQALDCVIVAQCSTGLWLDAIGLNFKIFHVTFQLHVMYYTSLPRSKQSLPFPLSHFSSNPTNKVVDRPKNKQLNNTAATLCGPWMQNKTVCLCFYFGAAPTCTSLSSVCSVVLVAWLICLTLLQFAAESWESLYSFQCIRWLERKNLRV